MRSLSILVSAALLALSAGAIAQTPLPNGIPGTPKLAAPKLEAPKVEAPKADVSTAAKTAALTKALPGQNFTDLALAEKGCGKAGVVWLNPNSGKSFEPGNRYFGKTKDGAYACAADAAKSGFVGAKNKF
ncbi:hypothetical protein [Elstera sp.]|jgi:hypothetical protein|uniref:hypothetical protein n=1 Tax=Elstera sp. TaxID=1916664 RepID=UPI0037C0247F